MFDWDDDGDVDSGDWAFSFIMFDGLGNFRGPTTLFGWVLTVMMVAAALFIWYLTTL